jgi:polyisoprenoid-binding protein YceI
MANTAAPVQTSTTTWNIDPAHSMAEFKVKHMMIANVKGQFSKVSGALFLDESDLANSRVSSRWACLLTSLSAVKRSTQRAPLARARAC